jgi:hypothetical protein
MSVEVTKSVAKMLARAGPILARLPTDKPVMVEIGVSTGLMSEYLLRTRADLIWHGVDPWLPVEDCSEAYRATNDIHSRLTLGQVEMHMGIALERIHPFGVRAHNVHRAMSIDAAQSFDAASVDLVFADGDHSYEGTSADIAAWWPKVKPGGWLGGHDINHQDPRFRFGGVDQAVAEFAERVGLPVELDVAGLCWFVRKP